MNFHETLQQVLNQKRDQWYVQMRKQRTNDILKEKRQTPNSQELNSSSQDNNTQESEIFIQIQGRLNQLVQQRKQNPSSCIMLSDITSELKDGVVRFIFDQSFKLNDFVPIMSLTYLFDHKVCIELIKLDLYVNLKNILSGYYKQACNILSNIFFEDEDVKFTFRNQVKEKKFFFFLNYYFQPYKTQFYQLLNQICSEKFTSDASEFLLRVGTNNFSPHSLIQEIFNFFLKTGLEQTNIEELHEFAMRIVEKNCTDLNQQFLQIMSTQNIGKILNDQSVTPRSKSNLLNILCMLFSQMSIQQKLSQQIEETLDQILTSSFFLGLECQLKSINENNKISTLRIIQHMNLKTTEHQMKFLNSNLIEFMLRILQVDSMKIKVETLKAIKSCSKSQFFREQFINCQLISYLIPLLRCEHNDTIIYTLKCIKKLLVHSTDQKKQQIVQSIKQLRGIYILERIVEVSPLAEEILDDYLS